MGCLGSILFDQETPPICIVHEFNGGFLKVSKCLAIHDDLYAVAGVNLVAVADLVIQ
jgi:hypothetical protein